MANKTNTTHQLKIEARKNYGGTCKLGENEVVCYTPKQMKSLYPAGDYDVVAEHLPKGKSEIWGTIVAKDQSYPLYETGTHSNLLYRVKGYVATGEDMYVAVLLNNAAFFAAISTAAVIVVLCAVLLGTELGGQTPHGGTTGKQLNLEEGQEDWEGIRQDTQSGTDKGIAIPGYKSITIDADKTDVKVNFQNPKGNPCYFEISLILQDGTVLYSSKMIEPGKGLYNITLNQAMSPGQYDAVIKYETYSLEGLTPMNGAEVKIVLIAK